MSNFGLAGFITFENDTVPFCEANIDTCQCNDPIGGNYRCDSRDEADPGNLESSITIDGCIDGNYTDPDNPDFSVEYIYGTILDISRRDLTGIESNPYPNNVTDGSLRVGDEVEFTTSLLCSWGTDSYNMLYKNNTESDTSWEFIAGGKCPGDGTEKQEVPPITRKLFKPLENVGNHTFRVVMFYGNADSSVTCGYNGQYGEYVGDTDDLVFEVIEQIDFEAPEIELVNISNGENDNTEVEYNEDQDIIANFRITDQTGVDFVNISLSYNNENTSLNWTKSGDIYTVNLTNLTNLGLYTFNFWVNDTIIKNDTTGTQNHIDNTTTFSFILKDDVGFNIISPKRGSIFSSILNILNFIINDQSAPYKQVYYNYNYTDYFLKDSKEMVSIESVNGSIKNNESNISQSVRIFENITIQRIDLNLKRVGNNINTSLIIVEDYNNSPTGIVLASVNITNINSSNFTWTPIWFENKFNLTENRTYWIMLGQNNGSDYIEWKYGNDSYIEGACFENISIDLNLKIFNLYEYITNISGKEGFNSVQIYENNSLGNIASGYTNYYIDLKPPIIKEPEYFSTLQYGDNQNIKVSITDTYSGVNKSSVKIEYDGVNDSMVYSIPLGKYTYTITNITPGVHSFKIYASDKLGWSNDSESYPFSSGDDIPPELTFINHTPYDIDLLDPNITVDVNFTLYDLGGISGDVYLQYKANISSSWEEVVAVDLGEGDYYANFTPTIETVYTYRVNATDNFENNINISDTEQNLEVLFERYWSVTPLDSPTQDLSIATTYNLYNFTVKNIGDVNISYSITKGPGVTYTMTFSNSTFTIGPEDNFTFNVNITTLGTGQYPSGVVITCLDSCPEPYDEKIVGSEIRVGGEGPFLDIKVYKEIDEGRILNDYYNMRYNDFSYTTPHKLVAVVENIAELYDAENITFWFEFPNSSTGWIAEYDYNKSNMTANFSLERKNFDDSTELNAVFLIDKRTDKFIWYDVIIHANLIYNDTWSNFTKTIHLNVTLEEEEPETINIIPPADDGGTTSEVTPPSITDTGPRNTGIGGGFGAGLIDYDPIITSDEFIDIQRGGNGSITLNLTNPFKNRVFYNVTWELSGYYNNQVTFDRIIIPNMSFNITEQIIIDINAPSYLGYDVRTISLVFNYKVGTDTGLTLNNGTTNHSFTLIINEVNREDSLICLEKSNAIIINATNLDFNTVKLEEIIDKQRISIVSMDFTLAKKYCDEIEDLYEDILDFDSRIKDIDRNVKYRMEEGYDMTEVNQLLNMTKNLLINGELDKVDDSLNDVENLYLLQVSIEDANIIKRFMKFLLNNIWKITQFIILLSVTSVIAVNRIHHIQLINKIRNLNAEQKSIEKKNLKLQEEYYKNKSFSREYFDTHRKKNSDRLAEIKTLLSHYKNNHSKIKGHSLESLEEEEAEIHKNLEELQKNYYFDKTIDNKNYNKNYRQLKKTLSKIEKDKKIQIEKEKKLMENPFYKKFNDVKIKLVKIKDAFYNKIQDLHNKKSDIEKT
ncbi:hypothetical protein C0585_06995 [Candidatus Woesearchaeota archaeon]|nr:MAG: hypothetical protein C0585_06995 [Candidatus Woesearchaeota archaeon]